MEDVIASDESGLWEERHRIGIGIGIGINTVEKLIPKKLIQGNKRSSNFI